MHAESFNDGQRLQHVSYASQLLVPGEDVAVIPRVVVAFAMKHDAVTRRKESVAVLKCADVNRRLFGKRDSSMTSVYLVNGACRVLHCRSRFEDGRQSGTVHWREIGSQPPRTALTLTLDGWMERPSLFDATQKSLSDRVESVFSTTQPQTGISAAAAQVDMLGMDRSTRAVMKRTRVPRLPPSTFSQMPSTPLVRWNNVGSRCQSEGQLLLSSSSRPPTPVIAALNEALSECILPCPPPPARLPLAFSPSRVLSRPPLLTAVRPTHPTASLSPAHDSPLVPSSSHTTPARPTSPTRTSLDALRSIHTSTSTQFTTSQSVSRWWFQTDWDSASKERAASVLDEEDSKEDIAKNFRAPKAPLVFCHGLMGFDSVTIGPAIAPLQISHWRGIKEVLQDNGCEVLITRVPATSSPVDRAKVLEKTISETYPGRAVHLIGHSMGGIDCRHLITHLTQRSFSVLSLTTIATPHRGSTFANHFLSLASAHLPAVLALLELLPNGGGDGKAFECLTLEAMAEFNENTPDIEGVRYFSWGADYEPGLFDTWKYPHSVIYAKEGPNDGLVSVRSARWGTYLGTLKDVNHLDLVGWTDGIAGGLGLPTLNIRGMRAAVRGKEVGFSPGRFYLGVADLLAGVEEEEGYVKDGVWVGLRGRATLIDKFREREAPIVEGTPIQRSSSDKARARMEEVLRRTPSPSESKDGEGEEMDEAEGSQPMLKATPSLPKSNGRSDT